MKTFSIRLPEGAARWLRERAQKSGLTQSDIIRELLEREQNSKSKSVGERMAALGGTFKGGARDGSTNKKYFEGYGE
ncbi:MAG TPA: CopG family transcriptional regulator [Verrucomicrobiae bacterium]